ncbi:response regulator [Lentimicrobium sp. L6]|uniref:response regulator n=1 Tax=Lentimicrobium sp. L6 TaxID=2735916 RepID=UPI001556AC0F|nr:response regulator [Lentimicrobium sp. L6]NPD87033.1 response regulator [Lentimicrobium sp. L6]
MEEKTKIIYVDDEEVNTTLFKINFSGKYNVLTGYSGLDGLKLLDENPDTKVIISDMKMPNMNGIEFIQKAKAKYPNKRFYILTGFEITEEIRKALDNGLIHKYFKKPFNLNEIETAINEA